MSKKRTRKQIKRKTRKQEARKQYKRAKRQKELLNKLENALGYSFRYHPIMQTTELEDLAIYMIDPKEKIREAATYRAYMIKDNLLDLLEEKEDSIVYSHRVRIPLEERSTKELLRLYRFYRYNWSRSDYGPDKADEVKKILDTREHVLNPNESRLIKVMSKHVGEKLGFSEAQSLFHKLMQKDREKWKRYNYRY